MHLPGPQFWWSLLLVVAVGVVLTAPRSAVNAYSIGDDVRSEAESPPAALGGPTDALAPGEAVLVGAGDISICSNNNDEATALLLDGIEGTVFTLGDNVYETGTATEYANCYDPTWGRHKARTKPVVGNHEYGTTNATGYYNYFGASAGDPAKGYYSYDVGAFWHVVVLNSECARVGGCIAGSAQEAWLRAELEANATKNVLAMWHHPTFSSGDHGNDTRMSAIWNTLYQYGADLILTGHDHNYERFAPQNAAGQADAAYGIPSIVVGTGGRGLRPVGPAKANSVVRDSSSFGVLKLTLRQTAYDWQFVPVAGNTLADAGTSAVHAPPPQATSTPTVTATSTPSPTPTVTSTATATLTATATAQPDADADGLSDAAELAQGTDPFDPDTDDDGHLDPPQPAHASPNTDAAMDNCPTIANAQQQNTDGNFIALQPARTYDDATLARSDARGDACDGDDDNDGLRDELEGSGAGCAGRQTGALAADSDADLYLDGAECALGTNPLDIASKPIVADCTPSRLDTDSDRLNDDIEFCFYNTSPSVADTDGDGCPDGKEAGSINGDAAINSIDLQQVALEFGPYAVPAPIILTNSDVNKDVKVSSIDLFLIAFQFGSC